MRRKVRLRRKKFVVVEGEVAAGEQDAAGAGAGAGVGVIVVVVEIAIAIVAVNATGQVVAAVMALKGCNIQRWQ
jgi:hypothetical protein